MLNTVLHYLTLIFAVACFAIIYFRLLSMTVARVTNTQNQGGKITPIYTSFFLRLCLAFVFFYCLLKYYNDIRDIIVMCLVFIATRYFVIRHERSRFLSEKDKASSSALVTKGKTSTKSTKGTKTTKNAKSTKTAGFSQKSTKGLNGVKVAKSTVSRTKKSNPQRTK